MSWRDFEKNCEKYLNETYGKKFKRQGDSNSTISDILFLDKKFYIEVKQPL